MVRMLCIYLFDANNRSNAHISCNSIEWRYGIVHSVQIDNWNRVIYNQTLFAFAYLYLSVFENLKRKGKTVRSFIHSFTHSLNIYCICSFGHIVCDCAWLCAYYQDKLIISILVICPLQLRDVCHGYCCLTGWILRKILYAKYFKFILWILYFQLS